MPQTDFHCPTDEPDAAASPWIHAIAPDYLPPKCIAPVMGIFPGEGVGPEVIRAALKVLDAVELATSLRVQRRWGCEIGLKAQGAENGSVTDEAAAFCRDIFADNGALFCGPAGGRFVYDLRLRFDLFCKLVPLRPSAQLHACNRLKRDVIENLDILVVRDNAGGIYQGSCITRHDSQLGNVVEHRFNYSQLQVERIVAVAARLARARKGRMAVVVKDGGVPRISGLWRRTAEPIAAREGVTCAFLNADYAAYELIQNPRHFDVMVAPNMLGDILADLGAVLLGSRGLSFSGNFSAEGASVYQTGHGAAYNLAGTDRANPAAQMLSLAMLLRESYGLSSHAALIEAAIEHVWHSGWRTDDLAEPGCRLAGTQQIGDLVAQAVLALSPALVSV
jgi:3-isopropylmalate dehydrogenase